MFDSSNLKELLSMMSILLLIQLVLGKISQFFINNSWSEIWSESTFNTNFNWNASDITHIFTTSTSIVYDSFNLKELLSMMSSLVLIQLVLGEISQFFVNNNWSEISSEITNEISLQLSIQMSHKMYLTLHISSQKVLLLCLIPPMWKLY